MLKMTLAAALSLAALLPAQAQKSGDWVLARRNGNPYWYPAVVQARSAASVDVLYDDGTREARPAAQVKAYNWRVGSRVECLWHEDNLYYTGKISSLRGDALRIDFDQENTAEDTSTGKCRAR